MLRLARRPTLGASLSRLSSSIVFPGTPRALTEITKLDALQEEEPARVSAIWRMYHTDQPSVAGECIDAAEHERIEQRGSESPMFVFPIRREGGHFMLFSQYTAEQRMCAAARPRCQYRAP